MIRRPANFNTGTIANPTYTSGFVLAWLIRTDSLGNQSLIMVFEFSSNGQVSEVPDIMVTFTDNSPPSIPEII